MFTKERLYTPEGGFVTEVTVPAFETKPDVMIWGARVFVRVDSFSELDFGGISGEESLGAIAERATPEEAYVEAFAYYVPPTAEELPRRPDDPRVIGFDSFGVQDIAAEDVTLKTGYRFNEAELGDMLQIAPDHYESVHREELAYDGEGVATQEGLAAYPPPVDPWQAFIDNSPPALPGETPLYDRVFIPDGEAGAVRRLCNCGLPRGYHYATCDRATEALLAGTARQVYKKEAAPVKVFSRPECPYNYCSEKDGGKCKEQGHCQYASPKAGGGSL